eukprot:TRINITY_DN13755_c0_g1_i1.p2 TRINITY_DN13755_c0_g1~~TRINITY_DN13755_c0_g1_i1.p2  ORF type:complete len:54 (-),score=11.41 TRINITY_DN13755_c0_g1_i1:236-397(-)
METLLEDEKNTQRCSMISIIGHSLGGMYARYVSGELHKLQNSEELQHQVDLSE